MEKRGGEERRGGADEDRRECNKKERQRGEERRGEKIRAGRGDKEWGRREVERIEGKVERY